MRLPGFGPGSPAWEADVLAKLDYSRSKQCFSNLLTLFKLIGEGKKEKRVGPQLAAYLGLVICTSLITTYGQSEGVSASIHQCTCCRSFDMPIMLFSIFRALSLRRTSFQDCVILPFSMRNMPSRGIVEKSPVA